MAIREAARSAAKELGYMYPDLKPEQLEVVKTFVKGCDLFAVFPTGYGKSLSLAAFPASSTSISSTHAQLQYSLCFVTLYV